MWRWVRGRGVGFVVERALVGRLGSGRLFVVRTLTVRNGGRVEHALATCVTGSVVVYVLGEGVNVGGKGWLVGWMKLCVKREPVVESRVKLLHFL